MEGRLSRIRVIIMPLFWHLAYGINVTIEFYILDSPPGHLRIMSLEESSHLVLERVRTFTCFFRLISTKNKQVSRFLLFASRIRSNDLARRK